MVELPEPLPIPESKLKSIVDIGRERVRHVIRKIRVTRKDAAEQKNLSNEPERRWRAWLPCIPPRHLELYRLGQGEFPANGKVEKQIELFINHIDPHSTR